MDPAVGFECSLGIAAAFHVLTIAYCTDASLSMATSRRAHQIGLRLMHIANVWVTHVWEKFARREEGGLAWYEQPYIDDSAWPISLPEINLHLSAVQRVLAQSDPGQHALRRSAVPHDFRDPKLSIGICTLCAYPPEHALPRWRRAICFLSRDTGSRTTYRIKGT